MPGRKPQNVFADLSFPDPDTHAAKAKLVQKIEAIINKRGLSQTEAAEIAGLSQPDVSKMLKGQFRPFSIERLMLILIRFGRDVEIVVKKQHRSGELGRMTVES